MGLKVKLVEFYNVVSRGSKPETNHIKKIGKCVRNPPSSIYDALVLA